MARFNTDGTRDAAFGMTLTANAAGEHIDGYRIALDSVGRAVIAARTVDYRFVTVAAILIRLTTAGVYDATFGAGGADGDGRTTLDLPGSTDPSSPAVQPDGKIVVAGLSNSVVRVNADGSIDRAFGVGGLADVAALNGSRHLRDVALDADGRILVAGIVDFQAPPYGSDTTLTRLNPDGSLDTGFGNGGSTVLSHSDLEFVPVES